MFEKLLSQVKVLKEKDTEKKCLVCLKVRNHSLNYEFCI